MYQIVLGVFHMAYLHLKNVKLRLLPILQDHAHSFTKNMPYLTKFALQMACASRTDMEKTHLKENVKMCTLTPESNAANQSAWQDTRTFEDWKDTLSVVANIPVKTQFVESQSAQCIAFQDEWKNAEINYTYFCAAHPGWLEFADDADMQKLFGNHHKPYKQEDIAKWFNYLCDYFKIEHHLQKYVNVSITHKQIAQNEFMTQFCADDLDQVLIDPEKIRFINKHNGHPVTSITFCVTCKVEVDYIALQLCMLGSACPGQNFCT